MTCILQKTGRKVTVEFQPTVIEVRGKLKLFTHTIIETGELFISEKSAIHKAKKLLYEYATDRT